MPYDASSPLETQIRTSVSSSLRNLRPAEVPESESESYIDCLLLHSPLPTVQQTLDAWRVLESYVPDRIRALGISNTPLATLQAIYDTARVKPAVVQNRFHAQTGWDVELRRFCRQEGVVYESFWTLTGNKRMLGTAGPVVELSQLAGVSREVAMYCLVIELGGTALLNGTTSEARMKEDLEDVVRVRNWTFVYADRWKEIVDRFRTSIKEK